MKNSCFEKLESYLMDNEKILAWIESNSIFSNSPILRIKTINNSWLTIYYIDDIYYLNDDNQIGPIELATSIENLIKAIKRML